MASEGVSKTVLKEGDGNTPHAGREVSVHFVGKYIDAEGQEVVFNSSRERNDPLRFTIGRDHTIPGLEQGVCTMREGELARLVVKPEMAFGPMGNPHGFHGSGKGIPANTTLIFDTELLTVDEPVGNDAVFSDPMEKYKAAVKRKEEGNALFKQKKNGQAGAKWSASVGMLVGIKTGPPNPAIDFREVDALLLSLYNNLAYVSLLNNDFTNALRHSKEALLLDEKNTKALYRKGKAHKELKNYEESKNAFEKCLELTKAAGSGGTTVKSIMTELENLKPFLAQDDAKTQKFWKGTFNKLEETELVTKEDIKESQETDLAGRMRKCQICGEEVEDVQLARHVIKKHSDKPKK